MSFPLSDPACWRRGYLHDVVERALTLLATVRPTAPAEPEAARAFLGRALDLRERLIPFLGPLPDDPDSRAPGADPDLRAALVQVYFLIQVFLAGAERVEVLDGRLCRTADEELVADRLAHFPGILTEAL